MAVQVVPRSLTETHLGAPLHTGDGRRLFPAGPWVYLPLNPMNNEDKEWALWVAHRDAEKPALSRLPDRPLVPILLDGDGGVRQKRSGNHTRTKLPVEGNEAETIVPSPESTICRTVPAISRMEPVYFAFDTENLNLGPDPSRWA